MSKSVSIRWDRSQDNIVVLTLDDPNQSVNTMNVQFEDSLAATIERLQAERDGLVGVIITSAKKTFFAGGDLKELIAMTPKDALLVERKADSVKRLLRDLETFGLPVVAAINGSALGGGLEIALACHYRIVLDTPNIEIGLPEVRLGLLPGGGGVVRTVRLLGVQSALNSLLLTGDRYSPEQAVELGIVNELSHSISHMMDRARKWIAIHPTAEQPWDRPEYQMPGGFPSDPELLAVLPTFAPLLRKKYKGAPMPAPRNILAAAVEGAQVDFATASSIETRYFTELVCSQLAKNMINAFFFDLQRIKAGGSRPAGFSKHSATTVGVVGAGMMGAGIAYSCARAGLNVHLVDVSVEAAERGKAYAERIVRKDIEAGGCTQADGDALLSRLVPTASMTDLADADLIIEAVFEDPDLKRQIFAALDLVLSTGTVIASNTSTLPITDLAKSVAQPDNFIGLHFFSPVDRMELVEVIAGEKTSSATLAKAVDIVQQLHKIPIVVSDSRGFFTSRVILSRLTEAAAMLGEGVSPSSIEQASSQAGYPLGSLALLDELTLSLPLKIRGQFREAAEADGEQWQVHPGDVVLARMVEEFDRPGRSSGAGFYEYSEGKRGLLWPLLADVFRTGAKPVPFTDLKDRLLFAEVVESLKCLQEGVIHSSADANIGSIYGIGFPSWSGGVVQFVAGYPEGVSAFVSRANFLAEEYGPRFRPPTSVETLIFTMESVSETSGEFSPMSGIS